VHIKEGKQVLILCFMKKASKSSGKNVLFVRLKHKRTRYSWETHTKISRAISKRVDPRIPLLERDENVERGGYLRFKKRKMKKLRF